jgi:hypothetical protein
VNEEVHLAHSTGAEWSRYDVATDALPDHPAAPILLPSK